MSTKTELEQEVLDLKAQMGTEELVNPNIVSFIIEPEVKEKIQALADKDFNGNLGMAIQRALFVLELFNNFKAKGMIKVTVQDPNNVGMQSTFNLQ